MKVDGELHEFSGYSVAVGNSKAYGGGMIILPQAELDDGKLDVMLVKDCSQLRYLAEHAEDVQGRAHRLGARASSCAARRSR